MVIKIAENWACRVGRDIGTIKMKINNDALRRFSKRCEKI